MAVKPGWKSIVIVLIVVLITFFGYASYQGAQYPKEQLWLDLPDEPSRPMPTFENFTLADGVRLPRNITEGVPAVEVIKPSLSNLNGREFLERYDFYHDDGATIVDNGTEEFKLTTITNYTLLDYEGAFIKFQVLPSAYDPVPEEELETNDSLLDSKEALTVAINYLTEHDFYNSTWEKTWTLKRIMEGGGETYIDYQYIFTPILLGRPLIDPDMPFLSIIVSPKGQIIHFKGHLRAINITSEQLFPKYTDPVDALVELEDTSETYFSSMDEVVVLDMDAGYMYEDEKGIYSPGKVLRVVPCWTFYIGPDVALVVNI
jgi:hypothetical protein